MNGLPYHTALLRTVPYCLSCQALAVVHLVLQLCRTYYALGMVPYRPYLWGVLRTVPRSGSTGSTGTILPVVCTTVREGTTYYGTVLYILQLCTKYVVCVGVQPRRRYVVVVPVLPVPVYVRCYRSSFESVPPAAVLLGTTVHTRSTTELLCRYRYRKNCVAKVTRVKKKLVGIETLTGGL